jgi:superfamily II DNA/RNA helicase
MAHHVAEADVAHWDLSKMKFIVLDEADRLLEPSFALCMETILPRFTKTCQYLLYSATNTRVLETVQRILPDVLDPSAMRLVVFVSSTSDTAVRVADGMPVSDNDGAHTNVVSTTPSGIVPKRLHQAYIVVPRSERLCALYAFLKLRVNEGSKVIVFCSTCASSIFHCMFMGSVGFHDNVLMLHGDMKHRQRVSTYDLFLKSSCMVLFTTDVAARGLDVPDVSWVLQFDPPADPVAYVHRIGRTARASRSGRAVIFLEPSELGFVDYLRSQSLVIREETGLEWDAGLQEAFDAVTEEDPIVARAGGRAYTAFLHGYQSHLLGEIFSVDALDLEAVACSFALQDAPLVTLKRKDKGEGSYQKGKVKSMMTKMQKDARKLRQAKRGNVWSLR